MTAGVVALLFGAFGKTARLEKE